jgi:N,N'-diacetyllegionaminate synthase
LTQSKTLIIAEAGVNHNGDLSIAKDLIEVAASSGADYVKFQTFKAHKVVQINTPKVKYQVVSASDTESQFEMLSRLELEDSDYLKLIKHAHKFGIGFISTAFDIESANLLLSLKQEIFKIPSGEITNLPYLRHIGSFGKRIILSTGMSNLNEVKEAIKELEVAGTPRSQITVLHCTSSYPAPVIDVNLLAMLTIKETMNVAVGYSDHTLGIEVSIAAVALGASVIEKHFTLDRKLPGPDHKASLEPNELISLVSQIRNVERALGDGVKRPMPSEMETLYAARRSIVAKNAIRKGEVFSVFNLTAKRPGTGISPMAWDRIVGSKASRDFDTDELIDES